MTPNARTFCAVGDLYCATPEDDFATRMAGFLAQNSSPVAPLTGRYAQEAMVIVDDVIAAGGIPTLQAESSDGAYNERSENYNTFLKSRAHQDYANYVVDRSGATATSWLSNWLRSMA